MMNKGNQMNKTSKPSKALTENEKLRAENEKLRAELREAIKQLEREQRLLLGDR